MALAAPGEEGENPTVREHVRFGATCRLQVVETENSPEPETLPPSNVTVAPLFFGAVLVRRTTLTLLRPTLTMPKFNELAETFT